MRRRNARFFRRTTVNQSRDAAGKDLLSREKRRRCRPFYRQKSRLECFTKAFAETATLKIRPNHPHRLARCTNPNHMPVQEDVIEIEGRITSVLAGTMFRVELANKHEVLAHISGRMRKSFIRLTTGDRVKLEMSPYDLTKARIVYRLQG
jgi:translation initiation factor IF-1